MALEQKLSLRMSQKLVMTPSLQQAIKLLQLTKLELSEHLTTELEQNPCLDDPTLEVASDAPAATLEKEEAEPSGNEEVKEEFDVESFFQDYMDDGYRPKVSSEVRELPSFENTLTRPESLPEHLRWQLGMEDLTEREMEIGEAIIGNLDDDGYLVASDEDFQSKMGMSPEEVGNVLDRVQRFDPVGVAARDLKECLLLQLRHLHLEGSVTEAIVRDALPLLEAHKFQEIAKRFDLSLRDVQQHWDIIRTLDPKPGRKHNVTPSHYVTPDVFVIKLGEEYVVHLNEEGLPRLRISPVYRQMLAKGNPATSSETRNYVREKFKSALWLVKSVEQRQRTIYKVAESIVKQQRDFLDHGVSQLRPMVLRDVARDIDMHESTVSRVVTNKYMHTPRGVYEMKFFFHGGIGTTAGGEISSVSVKERIKKFIEAEDPRRPMSDSKIAKELRKQGLDIARRTIAKYRETMNIPPSSRRKSIL
ncbi:MAG: RNA polymerase factor sigma-54 [Acidobacteriota bacterium]